MVKVKKPKAILLDICDIAVKTGFEEKTILPYFRAHIKSYLEENWVKPETQEDIERIRGEPLAGEDAPKIPAKGAEKSEAITALISYANYCIDKKLSPKGFTLLKFHVIFTGYEKGALETPVFSDVAIQLQKWRCDLQIRLFAVFKGCPETTKHFLGATNHGDLNLLIDATFGDEVGPLTEPATFEKILENIKQQPEDVLFLSKSREEYAAAKSSNIVTVLLMMHRRQVDKTDEGGVPLERIRNLNELQFE